jgi:hypothetical protein
VKRAFFGLVPLSSRMQMLTPVDGRLVALIGNL